MRVLITGANGFVGKNLQLHLVERSNVEVLCFTRDHTSADLCQLVAQADLVFHLAGVNRPRDLAPRFKRKQTIPTAPANVPLKMPY